jgi:hypothetical protein
MAEAYWNISEINFRTIPQMRWLIDHLAEIRDGDWPIKPGTYLKAPQQACKQAKAAGYLGLCVTCPHLPCLNPRQKTPLRNRKERNINRVLEIAAEVEARLGLVMPYLSGEQRPEAKIYRDGNGIKKVYPGKVCKV